MKRALIICDFGFCNLRDCFFSFFGRNHLPVSLFVHERIDGFLQTRIRFKFKCDRLSLATSTSTSLISMSLYISLALCLSAFLFISLSVSLSFFFSLSHALSFSFSLSAYLSVPFYFLLFKFRKTSIAVPQFHLQFQSLDL